MRRSRKKHIFVVDDIQEVLESIGETLEDYGYKVSCFTGAADCLEQLGRLHGTSCDLLITDVKMPGMDGINFLKECERLYPWMPVVLITAFADITMAFTAGQRGATEFIQKPFTSRVLLSAVKSVLKRNPWDNPQKLTKRQIEVMRLILQYLNNREIAKRLHIEVRSVEDHCSQIYKRLGVNKRPGLFEWAYKKGLISPPEKL